MVIVTRVVESYRRNIIYSRKIEVISNRTKIVPITLYIELAVAKAKSNEKNDNPIHSAKAQIPENICF